MIALFLGGGRRVELAKKFIEKGWRIYSYEKNTKVPIESISTVLLGKEWSDPYIGIDIQNKIDQYKIDLSFPLQDEAVVVLAGLKNVIPSVVSSYKTALTCFDKLEFENFMLDNFKEYYPEHIPFDFPFIIKPRFGFGSKRIIYVWNSYDIPGDYHDAVIQRMILGKEYSVDSYFDRQGKWVDSIPRERLRVGSGEVITSKTIYNSDLIDLTREVGERLGIIGPSNTQIIIEAGSNKPYIIEVNARFGGGYTLSIEAGLDAIRLIEKDYFNLSFEYHRGMWERNFLLERSYRDHYYHENSN